MNCFLTWWLSVDYFRWRAVLQWNPFVVSLHSNQYFLRELIWEWVTCMHYHFWNLFACSLAKCVEVRLFDNENKASNFFNMTLKNNYYFWIRFATKKPFFFRKGFSKPFANALVWLLSPTWTWQLAMTFEFTFIASEWLANFQSDLTNTTRRGKSLETPPQCLWITDPKWLTARAPVLDPLSRCEAWSRWSRLTFRRNELDTWTIAFFG